MNEPFAQVAAPTGMTKPIRRLLWLLPLASAAACSNSATLLQPSDDGGAPSEGDAGTDEGDGPSGDGDGDGDQPPGDGDGDPPSGDGDGDTPADGGDGDTPAPGSCEHQAKFVPSKDHDMLQVGDFCDTVSICFGDGQQAQAAGAAHQELTCGEQGNGECAPERSCYLNTVHNLDAEKLANLCSILDAAAGTEQVTCMVFL